MPESAVIAATSIPPAVCISQGGARWIGGLMLVLCLFACRASDPPQNAAYLWSLDPGTRFGNPEQVGDRLNELRMLWVEVEPDGALRWSRVGHGGGRFVAPSMRWIPVVRMDGRAPVVEPRAFARALRRSLEAWPEVNVIEIDHDAASARLLQYRDWLGEFRREWPMAIQITALPDWLGRSELTQLQAEVYAVTLQVHAVDDPRRGLLDDAAALRWSSAMAKQARVPYWIALPTYRATIAGQVHWPDPLQLQSLQVAIAESAGRQFQGVAWFRLPALNETRALSRASFAALLDGRPVLPESRIELRDRGQGRFDVWLQNPTHFHAKLPMQIDVFGVCQSAAVAGFRQRRSLSPDQLTLESLQQDFLPPRQGRRVAWLVCPKTPSVRVVDPRSSAGIRAGSSPAPHPTALVGRDKGV